MLKSSRDLSVMQASKSDSILACAVSSQSFISEIDIWLASLE
jgi:hypothetical protein